MNMAITVMDTLHEKEQAIESHSKLLDDVKKNMSLGFEAMTDIFNNIQRS